MLYLLKSASASLIMVANKDKGRFCWNDGEPKYDIRDWSPDGTRMGKGISLSHDEMAILKGLLDELEL